MSLRNKVVKSSIVNVIDQMAKLVAVFFLTPLMVAELGDTRYGLWILIGTFFSYYKLLDLGISFSAPRFIGQADGNQDWNERTLVVNICFRYFVRMSLIAAAVTLIAILVVPLFSNSGETRLFIRYVAAAFGLSIALRYFFRIYQVLLKSALRYDLIVSASIARVLLQFVLIYVLLSNGYGLVALAIAQAGCDILESLLYYVFAKRVCPDTVFDKKIQNDKKSREILRYSLTVFGASNGHLLKERVDPFLVGGLIGIAMVPIYSIGTRLLSIFCELINGLFGSHFMVALSQVEGRDGSDVLRDRILEATKLCAILTTFIGGSFAIFSGPFLMRWVGPNFSDSYRVLLILIFPYVIFLMQYPGISGLYVLSKHKFMMIATWAGALFNLLLSLLLGISFGFFGIVWATFVEMFLLYCLIYPWGISRATGIPIGKYFSTIVFTSVKTATPLVVFYLLTRELLVPEYGRLMMLATFESAFVGVWIWFFMLSVDQRQSIRTTFHKKLF